MKNRSKNRHISHTAQLTLLMHKDNEGGTREGGQISLSCRDVEEATVRTSAHGI